MGKILKRGQKLKALCIELQNEEYFLDYRRNVLLFQPKPDEQFYHLTIKEDDLSRSTSKH